MTLPSELAERFRYHPAEDQATRDAHQAVRSLCTTMAEELYDLLPEGRHKALAFTALQETMWAANAAVAIDGGGGG